MTDEDLLNEMEAAFDEDDDDDDGAADESTPSNGAAAASSTTPVSSSSGTPRQTVQVSSNFGVVLPPSGDGDDNDFGMPKSKRARTIVTPFVVSKPPWLVGSAAAGAPAAVPWDERELLFFAGHIPKLYIRPTRYQIWRQLRRVPNVTLLSSTLLCGYGPFDTCAAVCRPSTAPRRCGSRCRTPPPYESCAPKTNEYWNSHVDSSISEYVLAIA